MRWPPGCCKRALSVATVLAASLWPSAAWSYRPFDSTDAAVAGTGELELELQPLGVAATRGARSLLPGLVVNWGVAPRLELVVEGSEPVRLGGDATAARLGPIDASLGVKGVLREGSLQGGRGPSLAAEAGLLVPAAGGGAGAGGTFIVSQRWVAATVHLDGSARWTRADGLLLGAGLIVEGPDSWTIRPVAELVAGQAGERRVTRTALGGLVWRVREGLSIDAAVKVGRAGGEDQVELRAGLTWSPGSASR